MKKIKYIIVLWTLFIIGFVACEQVNPPAELVNSTNEDIVSGDNLGDQTDDDDDDGGGDDDN
jgi:hypothetical protein